MQYEIRSIEPIEGDQNLLVEIWHWHDNAPIGNRDPHHIEHVRFMDLPKPTKRLILNDLEQPLMADGTWGNFWFLNIEDEWERRAPGIGDPLYAWEDVVPDIPAIITAGVEGRSRAVKAQNLRTVDTFPANQMPPTSNRPSHVGRRPDVLAMRRKRGRVD